ncbi:DUF4062 domain-containing protein [Clostridium cylindrosporum]|uniref:DUF4062 domain-containing protein n=1 Tax=Clostridium cylindrosporum DSM 605 TaxID=1121307 RepID=A0A0J8DC61_CLOCY|nr:DUF4062 domain-containing protein [Clostridium cylindrosporum]KMT21894.1 hypothetical protein CLCY_3c01650 [Clostridium cylindrosporum DSM 605]
MAGIRVFVSSTCYDLNILRSQLRVFLNSLGYEPMMSDFNDILYDPRTHTHTSCVDEVSNCDILVLIIGSRFGGQAVPEAIDKINFEGIEKNDINVEMLKNQDKVSITQLEVLKAIEQSIPVYTFIEQKVWHDHQLYQKNKSKAIIKQIDFPSIEKQDTAEYIFEFINFVRLRSKGNNIFTFNKIDDIESVLKKQWSSYFQRLLSEQRYNYIQGKKIENLTNQFEDLKTAILTSIGSNNQKEVAMGVVKYRRLFEFIQALRIIDFNSIKTSILTWEDLLEEYGIVKVLDCREIDELRERGPMGRGSILLKDDDTFYLCRYSIEVINELSLDWGTFTRLNNDTRSIIADALSEIPNRGIMMSYFRESLSEYIERKYKKYSISEYVVVE